MQSFQKECTQSGIFREERFSQADFASGSVVLANCPIDQQTAAWFESNFYELCTHTLMIIDNGWFCPQNFANLFLMWLHLYSVFIWKLVKLNKIKMVIVTFYLTGLTFFFFFFAEVHLYLANAFNFNSVQKQASIIHIHFFFEEPFYE